MYSTVIYVFVEFFYVNKILPTQAEETVNSNSVHFIAVTSCIRHREGLDYMGTENRTESGKQCLMWNDFGMELFPYEGKDEALNYCRNPDKSERLWCYTDSDRDWEYCNVPYCGT